MLRFLQDMARSAAGYLHPGHSAEVRHSGGGHLGSKEYIDKYSSRIQRGFVKQPFGTDVWESIQETQQKAHRIIVEMRPLADLKTLLQYCHHVGDVINIRDMFGYNLLQYAIIAGRVNVVRFLVLQGADLNLPICARPLHLAAKLGHADILRVLLDCGADPDVMSCVCYPRSHILQRTMFVSDTECWSVACFGDIYAPDKVYRVQFEYPLYYAIMSDCLDCVKLLVDRGGSQLSSRSIKLHTACCFGAFHCIQHFLKTSPSELSAGDHKGLYPLQHAVQWGKKITEYLVLKGALVTVKTAYRESLLLLFYNQTLVVAGLAETSAYLLDCGLKLMVNVVDAGGNSPLHALFKKLHRTPPKWLPEQLTGSALVNVDHSETDSSSPFFHKPDKTLKSSGKLLEESSMALLRSEDSKTVVKNIGYYEDIPLSGEEKEYLDTVVLLLRAGANTNVVNKVGNTCLHQLLKIQMVDSAKPVSDDVRGTYKHCSLRLVYCLLCVLLEHGANPRFINNMHVTVHGNLISSGVDAVFNGHMGAALSSAEPLELRYLLLCVKLLCEHGCSFTVTCASTPLDHTLAKLDALDQLENRQHMSAKEKTDLASLYTQQVTQVAEVMLRYGATPSDLHGLYYQLVKQYPILPARIIKEVLVLFLNYGADPNIGGIHIPMSIFRTRTDHSHWPVYPMLHLLNLIGSQPMDVKRDHDLYELFDVLYSAMNDNGSRQCMFHFLCFDSNQTRPKCTNTELLSRVELLMTTPRTLRQICAQWIFVTMCNRKQVNVQQLPYPGMLKRLILSIQY